MILKRVQPFLEFSKTSLSMYKHLYTFAHNVLVAFKDFLILILYLPAVFSNFFNLSYFSKYKQTWGLQKELKTTDLSYNFVAFVTLNSRTNQIS